MKVQLFAKEDALVPFSEIDLPVGLGVNQQEARRRGEALGAALSLLWHCACVVHVEEERAAA